MDLGDICTRPQGMEIDGNGSGLRPNLYSGISGVEPSDSVTRRVIQRNTHL
jgi:hypothetical protein